MADRKHLSDDARDKDPGAGEQAGEAVGGLGGVLAGAGIGSAAGPVGTIIGGIAGAAGGWWAGEKAGRAAEDLGEHDEHYRSHHRESRSDLEYDEARVGYSVGHVAGRNPDYGDRKFDDVEPEIRKGWGPSGRDYSQYRDYVREGYEHSRSHRRT